MADTAPPCPQRCQKLHRTREKSEKKKRKQRIRRRNNRHRKAQAYLPNLFCLRSYHSGNAWATHINVKQPCRISVGTQRFGKLQAGECVNTQENILNYKMRICKNPRSILYRIQRLSKLPLKIKAPYGENTLKSTRNLAICSVSQNSAASVLVNTRTIVISNHPIRLMPRMMCCISLCHKTRMHLHSSIQESL